MTGRLRVSRGVTVRRGIAAQRHTARLTGAKVDPAAPGRDTRLALTMGPGNSSVVPVSDRTTLEGLPQFPIDRWYFRPQPAEYARHRGTLRLKEGLRYTVSDYSQVVDFKRRDVRVVEGARLEIDSRRAC
jgi:hypothetical protein